MRTPSASRSWTGSPRNRLDGLSLPVPPTIHLNVSWSEPTARGAALDGCPTTAKWVRGRRPPRPVRSRRKSECGRPPSCPRTRRRLSANEALLAHVGLVLARPVDGHQVAQLRRVSRRVRRGRDCQWSPPRRQVSGSKLATPLLHRQELGQQADVHVERFDARNSHRIGQAKFGIRGRVLRE